MANLYKNKVIYGGNVLIDLTGDTVTADKVASGLKFHDKTGAQVTGTNTFDSASSVNNSSYLFHFGVITFSADTENDYPKMIDSGTK